MSSIEWTDETWNPTVGCSRVSPGCDGCYAIGVAHRAMQPAHAGLTVKRDGERADWTGEVRLLPDRLDAPLRWRKPRRVFVDSMSDLFAHAVPSAYVAQVFDVMALAEMHTFQVLTKRPQRMAALVPTLAEIPDDPPLPNVWLGTSVENQRYADLRIPHLLATPAAVRFLSIEPLLGPVILRDEWLTGEVDDRQTWLSGGVDWVIVGGESGPRARPMHPGWARDLRDQCVAAGVPFFFKQWGEWRPGPAGEWTHAVEPDGSVNLRPSREAVEAKIARGDFSDSGWHGMSRVGKKAAGRELDGREWNEYPRQEATP